VIAATLFRLHIHFLPYYFNNSIIYLSADDLTVLLNESLEKKFSANITELEQRVTRVMEQLEKFSDNLIVSVNILKTKAMLVHNKVSSSYPKNLLQISNYGLREKIQIFRS